MFRFSNKYVQQTCFVECVATLEETRNKGIDGNGYYISDEDTLTGCQRICLSDYPICSAVDYKDGKCHMFRKYVYYRRILIENIGNVHTIVKSCDKR